MLISRVAILNENYLKLASELHRINAEPELQDK